MMAFSLRVSRTAFLRPFPAVTFQSICSSGSSSCKILKPQIAAKSASVSCRWQSNATVDNNTSLKSSLSWNPLGSRIKRQSVLLSLARINSVRHVTTGALEERFAEVESPAESAVVDESSQEEFVNSVSVAPGVGPSSAPATTGGNFDDGIPGHNIRRSDHTVPATALKRGAVFKGTVIAIQPYGAFVNFGAYADGLIHISKLSTGYVRNVRDIVALGQEVTVTVLNVDQTTGRIALSMLEKEKRESRRPYAPSRQGDVREGSDWSRLKREQDERVSGDIYAPSRQGEVREALEAGASSRFQQGQGERESRDIYATARQGEAREALEAGASSRFQQGGRESRDPYASSRQEEAREIGDWSRFQQEQVEREFRTMYSPARFQQEQIEREFRNMYSPSRQGVGGEAVHRPRFQTGQDNRELRSTSSSFRQGEDPEPGDRSRFQQGQDGKPLIRSRIIGGEWQKSQEEPKKSKMKLVQIPASEVVEGTVENKVSSRMRWYDCDCCY